METLPPELVRLVLLSLDGSPLGHRNKALRACALVCRDWRAIAQEILPRRIEWVNPSESQIGSLLSYAALADREWVCDSLRLRNCSERTVSRLLNRADKVKSLRLASITSNFKDEHDNSPLLSRPSVAELESLSLFRTAIQPPLSLLAALHTLDLTLSTGFLDDESLAALLACAPHLATLRLTLCAMGKLALCDSSALSSLTSLQISDLLTDAYQLVPRALLDFISACPSLTSLKAMRYDPAQLESILSAVRTPLEQVHVEAYLTQGQFGPSLGATLRRAAGFGTMRGVRRWRVAIEVDVNNWAANKEWRDENWSKWEDVCAERGCEVELDDDFEAAY